MQNGKRLRNKKKTSITIAAFVLLWILWSLWQSCVLPGIHMNSISMLILDNVVIKGLLWAVIPLALLRWCNNSLVPLEKLFVSPIPWLPCLVAISLSAAFLHTLRLINGLMHTHVIYDPMMIVLSLTAGVFEEIGFRGCFFNMHEPVLSFWPAAAINGVVFVLFHYPGFIIGNFGGLLSLRTLLIFTMGIIFCWMFRRWKSLPLLIAVHTVWDLLSYLFCLT